MKLIDFHTHNPLKDPQIIQIYSPLIHEKNWKQRSYNEICLGIHPWYLHKTTINELENVLITLKGKVFALGEMGLDRSIQTSFSIQLEVFQKQIQLSKRFNINKVVIHNVKCHGEILQAIKEHNDLIFILHDFNAKSENIAQYLKFNNVYFSLSPNVFKTNFNISSTHDDIPLERLFLETDDSRKSIRDHYLEFSKRREAPFEHIRDMIYQNYLKIKEN